MLRSVFVTQKSKNSLGPQDQIVALYPTRHRVFAAVLQIRALVAGDQLDDTRPQPGWCVERFGMVAGHLLLPLRPCGVIHLSGVCLAHHRRQKSRHLQGLFARQVLDVEFQILRQQFPEEDRMAIEFRRQHAIAQGGCQVPRSLNDSLAIVTGHLGFAVAWRRRFDGLFDVVQARLALLPPDAEQDGVPQAAE
jgi:hypothetical protein